MKRKDLDKVFAVAYEELRRMASGVRRKHGFLQSPNTTAVLHDAYVRLAASDASLPSCEVHLRSCIAKAMRHVLIDLARADTAKKRRSTSGSQVEPDTIESPEHYGEEWRLPEALEALQIEDPKLADVVALKVFAGFQDAEVAQALGVSEKTAKRYWARARAWLNVHYKKPQS